MDNKSYKDKSFSVILRESANVTAPPAFDAINAGKKDKEAQWLYYFIKHVDEVKEVLDGETDVLCARLTWMEDNMPDFAEAMKSDETIAGSYISIGNKTLQRLQLEGYEPQKDAHIRFSDSQSIDAIAKDVRTAEIAPKKPKKKGEKAKELTLGDVLALPDYTSRGEIENIIVLKKSNGGREQDFFISAKLVNGELEHELTHYRAIPPQTAPSIDFHNQEYVSFAKVYKETYQTITDYAAFEQDSIYPKLISLGCIVSYFREVFNTYPYFDYISSEPEAGKTTAMKVQTFLSYYGTIASSVTEALLFREIDGSHCFYGLDNIERLFAAPKDYIGLIDWLLSSYSKDIPCKRLEKMDEDYRVRYFDGYGIKAFTHIRDFPFALRALRSRCIQIIMQTKKPKKFYPSAEKFTELRDKLYKARLYEFESVKKSYQECIDSKALTGRTGDLYYPLLSIAKLADDKLYNIILKYTRRDEGDRIERDSWNMMLIKVLLDNKLLGSHSTNEIKHVYEEALINEGLLKDATLATRTVTVRLKKLGFTKEDKKTENKTWFIIDVEKLMLKAHEYDILDKDEIKKYLNGHTLQNPNLVNLLNFGEDKDKPKEGSTEGGGGDKPDTEEIEETDLDSNGSNEELTKVGKLAKRRVCESTKNVCDKCGNDGATELYKDCYFHPECLKEIKHEEDKPPKVRAGISLGHGIEYEKIGGEKQ